LGSQILFQKTFLKGSENDREKAPFLLVENAWGIDDFEAA